MPSTWLAVKRLVHGLDLDYREDVLGTAIGEIQSQLRAGNHRLALELAACVMNRRRAPDRRALALEVLACARAPENDLLVAHLVLLLGKHRDPTIACAASAAIGDLPSNYRAMAEPRRTEPHA